ncbi:hypothetical protein BK121_08765 [Paenibacillus odorifer]|uniref:hypothetical protein n=1 Tax=Paenibacillus odorifer TaxID=189426 RepID=UPI00096E6DAA|nr:hypothetical protein [Paenibacillus odorifer]OMC72992.1 hypothetical protein BK121_08765 [Paenibacillus odorifer]
MLTPERIEEIKRDAQEEAETIYGNCSANITNIELLKLLAALEESQQQRDVAQANYKTYYAEATEVSKRLAEAQQTIARQREVLGFYANQEHWELPSFGRGQSKVTSDRGSKARELLKEGSDKV